MALNDIIAYKRALIASKAYDLESLRPLLSPSKKNFKQALMGRSRAFILEIKFGSPTLGVIDSKRAVSDPLDIARIYQPFADAISVLADDKFFHGSYDYVAKVSAHVTQPVLCKDVIVDHRQVYQARHCGADAVLLMLSVLDDREYQRASEVAHSLAMDVICEVHSEEEMARARRLSADIIGINNRDLNTLKVDVETSERLLPLAPHGSLIILESGFAHRSQILRFGASKRLAFLIGTSLMRAERTDLALREILFGRIKICGLTRKQDALCAYESGAYYGGLNFSPTSKRQVSLEQAREIKSGVPLRWGGVFVDQSIEEIAAAALSLSLHFVQLHGRENDSFIADLRQVLSRVCEIWRVKKIKDGQASDLELNTNADRLVLDTHHEVEDGGTGRAFDWRVLDRSRGDDRIIIAGGVDQSNARRASDYRSHALDIASGVEDGVPGQKCAEKIKQLFLQLWP